MHDRVRFLLVLMLIAVPCGTLAAPLDQASLNGARKLRDAAMKSSEAYALVRSLTTEVGPRFAGTPGDRAGVAWAEREMERLGFRNVRRMPVMVPRWVRGDVRLTMDDGSDRRLEAVALGGSIGTPEGGVRGEIVVFDDVAELRAAERANVEGRIVYLRKRMQRTREGASYGVVVANRRDGPSSAAAKGAAALVIRSVGTDDARFAHTGSIQYRADAPRIPAVAISNPDADMLDRLIAARQAPRLHLVSTARELPQASSANVIGEIPGTDRADEIVLLGAHLDSWDLGEGALDDGAGVAIVMAAAKLIAGLEPKPRRTLRVVLFANEEFGLSGSNAYRASLDAGQVRKHAATLEADAGDGPVYELRSRVSPEQLSLVRQIQGVLAAIGVAPGDNEATGGADTRALLRAGIPVLGPRLDTTRYFDHHHTANDTLDKIDPSRLNQSVAAFAVSAYLAARFEEPLQRVTQPPERETR
jgi:carboxypeptidase Q